MTWREPLDSLCKSLQGRDVQETDIESPHSQYGSAIHTKPESVVKITSYSRGSQIETAEVRDWLPLSVCAHGGKKERSDNTMNHSTTVRYSWRTDLIKIHNNPCVVYRDIGLTWFRTTKRTSNPLCKSTKIPIQSIHIIMYITIITRKRFRNIRVTRQPLWIMR